MPWGGSTSSWQIPNFKKLGHRSSQLSSLSGIAEGGAVIKRLYFTIIGDQAKSRSKAACEVAKEHFPTLAPLSNDALTFTVKLHGVGYGSSALAYSSSGIAYSSSTSTRHNAWQTAQTNQSHASSMGGASSTISAVRTESNTAVGYESASMQHVISVDTAATPKKAGMHPETGKVTFRILPSAIPSAISGNFDFFTSARASQVSSHGSGGPARSPKTSHLPPGSVRQSWHNPDENNGSHSTPGKKHLGRPSIAAIRDWASIILLPGFMRSSNSRKSNDHERSGSEYADSSSASHRTSEYFSRCDSQASQAVSTRLNSEHSRASLDHHPLKKGKHKAPSSSNSYAGSNAHSIAPSCRSSVKSQKHDPAVKVKCYPVMDFSDDLPPTSTEERFRSSVFIFLVDSRLEDSVYLSDLDRRRVEVEFKLKDFVNRATEEMQKRGIPPLSCLALCHKEQPDSPLGPGVPETCRAGAQPAGVYGQFVRRIQAIAEGEEDAKVQYCCDFDDSDSFFDCLTTIAIDVLRRREDPEQDVFAECLMPCEEAEEFSDGGARRCCCKSCNIL